MTTTIVLNTATGAVTEYDWAFQSLTDTYAASTDGLFTLGGNTDAGENIAAEFRAGTPGGQQVQSVGKVFIAKEGTGAGALIVIGRSTSWEYAVEARASGVAAVTPGRGISESYLGFGWRNTDGADFRIDRIDAEVTPSKNRRK